MPLSKIGVITVSAFLLSAVLLSGCSETGLSPSPADASRDLVGAAPDGCDCGSDDLLDRAGDAQQETSDGDCTDLTPSGTAITSECPNVTAGPPQGGAFAEGIYDLTHLHRWSSACGGYTITLREQLRVSGSVFTVVTDVELEFPVGPTGQRARVYEVGRVSDTELILHAKCDSSGGTPGVEQGLTAGSWAYSATPGELRFFEPGSRLIAVYSRR
jgi:hypothetical protein